jgi:ATP-dependent DNA helicase RecG
MFEDAHTEFKREYTPDLKKEVVAFANTDGGAIFVGRDDQGNIYPLGDADAVLSQVTSSIRNAILPDVTTFVNYDLSDKGIKVTVQEGTNKPYYLSEKGLKPSGVYVRQGASSVPASFEQIRQMIKLTDSDKYEAARAFTQNLTFHSAEEEFKQCDVAFGTAQRRSLGLTGADDLFTNLGLLLSDQCVHSIKIAVFDGVQKGQFKTRKELEGSILKQMHSAFDFLGLSNNLVSTFSGLERIEQYDYPVEAIREAMLNAIIHRDYSFSGSTIVNVYDNRMEFVSLGGLVPGLRKEDLFAGISQPRNEKLVF